jgi:hypothetical protein
LTKAIVLEVTHLLDRRKFLSCGLRMLEASCSALQRFYQSCFDEGRSYAMVVPLKLPARSCVDQMLKQSDLFVFGQVSLFVSNELVHQLQNPPPSFGHHHQGVS